MADCINEFSLHHTRAGGTGQLGLGTEHDYSLPQRWTDNDQVAVEPESVTSGGCHSAGWLLNRALCTERMLLHHVAGVCQESAAMGSFFYGDQTTEASSSARHQRQDGRS